MALLPLVGCGGSNGDAPGAQSGGQVSNPLSAEAQDLVNQGNLAQREGRYEEALDLFTQALELQPDHPVPQFGSLMAATAVGDTALVRTMRENLAVTGPELLEMLGPGGAMGGSPHDPSSTMPPGHPDIGTQPPDTLPVRPGSNG